MEASHAHIVRYYDREVYCYGELAEDSNFSVVCDDEWDDGVWTDGNPDGGAFLTWEEVVAGLQPHFNSDIQEISAC